METIIQQLTSQQIVALLVGASGLVFLASSLVGTFNALGVSISLTRVPRLLGLLFGAILLVPAVLVAIDKQKEPDTQVKTNALFSCVLPLQQVSRGEPLRIGNQWLFLGGTTVGNTPRLGNFYLIGGARRVPEKFQYVDKIAKGFTVGGKKFFFKTSEVNGEWARVKIAEDQATCP